MEATFHNARLITNGEGRVLAIEADSLTHMGGTTECDRPWVNPIGKGNMRGCGPLPGKLFNVYGLANGISVGYEYTEMSDMQAAEAPHMEWSIEQNQTCKDAILDFLEKSDGFVDVETCGDRAIWVKPSAKRGPRESALDHVIDLEVEGVSTWEAFKQVIQAANAKPDATIGIWPFPLFWLRERNPVTAFTEDECITLSLKNVTARRALCAVAAASPLTFQFRYACSDRATQEQVVGIPAGSCIVSNLSVDMWDKDGNEDSGVGMSREEHEAWTAEVYSLRKP
jgi:hypothetical protein